LIGPSAFGAERMVSSAPMIGAIPSALALALLLIVPGCGDDRAGPARAPAALDPSRPLGAVVIVLDTLRSDHLSSYGYERPTSPAIDELARRGSLFETVASYSTWTLPSMAALLAGDYPPLVFDEDLRMQRSLVEAISEGGYRTAAFAEGGYVSRRWGMDRGFDEFSEERALGSAATEVEATFGAARRWLEADPDSPFFLLIHTYEVHMPYTNRDFAAGLDPGRVGPRYELDFLERVRAGDIALSEAERAYIRALYDGDIRSADRQVGEFMAFLREIGIADRTLVVVTSDHGEEMGEEFPLYIGGHGHSLLDNLLLVPLVIRDPTRDFAGKRITAQVRSLDVLPTVAELLGVELREDIGGRSLLPLLLGTEVEHRAAMSAENNRGAPQVAVRDGRYKLIRSVDPGSDVGKEWKGLEVPATQLYDLLNDPDEDVNLAAEKPRLARAMGNSVARWFNGLNRKPDATQPEVADEKLLERLRALGYVD
jgi:arylsulfatase A-like enzyme